MKLRYEKCMSSRVFKEPLRNINDNYLKIDNIYKKIRKYNKNKTKRRKNKICRINIKIRCIKSIKNINKRIFNCRKNGKIVIKS